MKRSHLDRPSGPPWLSPLQRTWLRFVERDLMIADRVNIATDAS